MLTKNKLKLIRSLDLKKYRMLHNLFIVEGEKMVLELIESNHKIQSIYVSPSGIELLKNKTNNQNIIPISEKELKQASRLKTPNKMLALVDLPNFKPNFKYKTELTIALDDLQDPGNMGTIIRTANWFGINEIYCSIDSVDVFNPKVIQSTMGAIFKTKVHYCNLKDLLNEALKTKTPIFGTTLTGKNIYHEKLTQNGIIVMGNESKGVSERIRSLINKELFIPTYPTDASQHVESLNVAVATSIVLSEFRRRE